MMRKLQRFAAMQPQCLIARVVDTSSYKLPPCWQRAPTPLTAADRCTCSIEHYGNARQSAWASIAAAREGPCRTDCRKSMYS